MIMIRYNQQPVMRDVSAVLVTLEDQNDKRTCVADLRHTKEDTVAGHRKQQQHKSDLQVSKDVNGAFIGKIAGREKISVGREIHLLSFVSQPFPQTWFWLGF